MAASPVQPAYGVTGPVRVLEGGEQTPDLRYGQREHPGVFRRRLVRDDRWRGLGAGAVFEQGGGDSADGQGCHHQHHVAGDRGVEPGLALVQPEAVLAELEILFHRPSQPGRADQPGLGQQLSLWHVAVAEGQLTGLEVAADQQVMTRRGGGDPRPGVPSLALGALPRGTDLPAPLVLDQPPDRLRAGQLDPRDQRDGEVRRWASTRPVSRPGRQPPTGLPGDYPDRTSTGRRRRASDQVMTAGQSPP